MTSVFIQSAAILDILEAAQRYDEHRPALGLEFTLEVDAAIDGAAEYPEMYEAKEEGARRVLVRRFPYSVYYLFEGRRIEVFAVLHQHREPSIWKGRIG